jgi:hypothetical protein
MRKFMTCFQNMIEDTEIAIAYAQAGDFTTAVCYFC